MLFSQFLLCRVYCNSSDMNSNITYLENCLSAPSPLLHSALRCWGWNSANFMSFTIGFLLGFKNRLHSITGSLGSRWREGTCVPSCLLLIPVLSLATEIGSNLHFFFFFFGLCTLRISSEAVPSP